MGGVVELYDVGNASRSEAELAVAKYLQVGNHLTIRAIEPLSAEAVKALGASAEERLGHGEVPGAGDRSTSLVWVVCQANANKSKS